MFVNWRVSMVYQLELRATYSLRVLVKKSNPKKTIKLLNMIRFVVVYENWEKRENIRFSIPAEKSTAFKFE